MYSCFIFESSSMSDLGHGIIITHQKSLDKYLGMLIRQAPIESQFFKRIHDNLNAEISLGALIGGFLVFSDVDLPPNAATIMGNDCERSIPFINFVIGLIR